MAGALVRILGVSILVVSGAACGSSDAPPSSTTTEASRAIGPAGGHISAGALDLDVPAGALRTTVTIQVSPDSTTPTGYAVEGSVYRLEPAGTIFSTPIEISFPTTTKAPTIYWSKASTADAFEALPTALENGRAVAHPTHFSFGFVGTESSGPDACAGAALEGCGDCGTRARTCTRGVWSDWSACTGEGECAPSTTQTCAGGSITQTCDVTCRWSACVDNSCTGPSSQACGNCGTQTRTCSHGAWSDWSACSGEGVCAPASVQSCAGGTQACSTACQWTACSSGVTCTSHDKYALPDGTCVDTPLVETDVQFRYESVPNDPSGNVTAGMETNSGGINRFFYGDGSPGFPSGSPPRFLSKNQTNTLYETDFAPYTPPNDEGTLTLDPATNLATFTMNTSRSTAADANGTACGAAVTVMCSGSVLLDGCSVPLVQSCGNCGTQSRYCYMGSWTNWSQCTGEGVCAPNATQACGGIGATQTCSASCQWNACPACAPPSSTALTAIPGSTASTGVPVLDSCNVYTAGSAGIDLIPKSGGSTTVIANAGALPSGGLSWAYSAGVSDGTSIYWSADVNSASAGNSAVLRQGAVWQTTLAGNVSTQLWSGANAPTSLALDGSNAYFGIYGGGIIGVPIAGGTQVSVSTDSVSTQTNQAIVTSGGNVFWASAADHRVAFAPAAGGGTTSTFGTTSATADPFAVATDGQNLYWSEFDSASRVGAVWVKSLTGGVQRTLYSGGLIPVGLAIDGSSVYVAGIGSSASTGAILKIDVAGPTVTTVAANQTNPTGVAVDNAFLYWSSGSAVMRIGK